MSADDDGAGRGDEVRAYAPGRVVLIGDHTDYANGLSLAVATNLGTTVQGRRGGGLLALTSQALPGEVAVKLPVEPSLVGAITPAWGRYPAAVAALLHAEIGLSATVRSTLPLGSGLSSSASIEIATALAFGNDLAVVDLAQVCRDAEELAVGVPCGLLDQITIVEARRGHAVLIDFATERTEQVQIPEGVDIVVVHSGDERALAGSAYADRRRAVETATSLIGPLRAAQPSDLDVLPDGPVRRRARHVVTENQRVRQTVAALRAGDLRSVGRLMVESHLSLKVDMAVSTPALDALADHLTRLPGVFGARLTGAGFGGCVVALTETGAIPDPAALTGRGWIVQPSAGASVNLDPSRVQR